MWRCAVVFSAVLLVGCTSPPTPTIPVNPMCALLAVVFTAEENEFTGLTTNRAVVFVSERTDPSVSHGFTRFRRITGPFGNSAAGSRSADVYGISEAWLRTSKPTVFRAEVHPALRPAFGDFDGSAWSIRSQDDTGAWSGVRATGSANAGNDQDDRAAAGLTVPQLMEVGSANRQLFACAGDRSDDDRVGTTALFEVTSGGARFIQDLLNGDDRFVPNAPGPLIGPAKPPTPTITGRPGSPVTDGSVQCAMTQSEDDPTTRELHMLTISKGALYHSMASNFSAATTESGSTTFDRFNTVTPWTDVSQAVGNLGTITAATLVASRPTAISVFFVAELGSRYRLHHAIRFSPGGSWRAADDVLALNGGTLNGTNFQFNVAAGMCPVLGVPHEAELVYAMWDEDLHIHVGRVVSTPRAWEPGVSGIYSPLNDISIFRAQSPDGLQQSTIPSLVIGTRPFSDDARPPMP